MQPQHSEPSNEAEPEAVRPPSRSAVADPEESGFVFAHTHIGRYVRDPCGEGGAQLTSLSKSSDGETVNPMFRYRLEIGA